MNDQNHTPQDDELEGFDTFEDDTVVENDLVDEPIDDADFQDISEDVDADVFGEGEPAPVAKKKTNWFNIGVATIAIVVAGGLIFVKLGPQLMGAMGGGDSVPVSAQNSPEPMQGTLAAADAQAAAQAALAPVGQPREGAKTPGLLDSPDQFANLNDAAVAAPVPAQPAPVVNNADPFAGVPAEPAPVAAAPVAPAQPAVTQAPLQATMPAPVAASPAPVSNGAIPAPVTAEPTLAASEFAPAPVAPVAAPSPNSAALESKVSTLESRLDEMDSKLTAIAQAPAASDSRLNSIQTTLERLETRLDSIGTSRAAAPRQVSDTPVITGDDAPVAATPKKTTRKAATKTKKTPSNQWDKAYAPARATQVSGGTGGGWELRGATPGHATVARGNDIREVGVGETLPGLGEITGVAQINGQWVVQGTLGRLAQ